MKITEYVKKEFDDFNKLELFILIFSFSIILFNAFIMKDSLPVVISAVCGISYTVMAGKGKVYCYVIGLCGSAFYSYISLKNALYGSGLLYLFYYIPLQVLGFYYWKRNLKNKSFDIVKTKLPNKQRFYILIVLIFGIAFSYLILKYFNDINPIIDAVTTFASIIAMYLTVRRCIEQWILWFVVNFLSLIMWLCLVIQGVNAYSTLVTWFIYTFLAVYFYILWEKDLPQQDELSDL